MNQPLELTVVMYHYVRDPGDAAAGGSQIPGMGVRHFETQLDELSRQYTLVTWPQVRAALHGGRPLPGSACLLTFDDGTHDHYINVFRILRERGLSGLFFAIARQSSDGLILAHKIQFLLARLGLVGLREVIWERLSPAQRERFAQAETHYQRKYPPDSRDGRISLLKAVLQRELSDDVDGLLSELFETHIGSEQRTARSYYLNHEQVREMAAGGMYFGGHSRSHPWFDWIDAVRRVDEIRASAEWLRQVEPGPWAFAYPYGGLCGDAPGLLESHGFIAGFTTRSQLSHTNRYFIGRLDGEEMVQEEEDHA